MPYAMIDAAAEQPSFARLGSSAPSLPVVLAVPHAGRVYPPALLAESRLPAAVLGLLADGDADRLIGQAVAAGAVAVVATRARAWLDLNRDPREIDARAVAPSPPRAAIVDSAKVRGGLGVLPTRIAGHGAIRRHPLPAATLAGRLARDHEPYHRAVAHALTAAHARFGIAILLDIHSMPSLEPAGAALVIGDRQGRSAGRRLTEQVMAAARAQWPVALNDPYAGGYTLERHGRPREGVHAVQIEFDRALDLGPDGRGDARRIERLSGWLGALALQLAPPQSIAAE